MSSKDRIFADDWRDCLREQYRYVIRQQDKRTEATLTEVLQEVGFSEDELAALKLEATMRADQMPDDYVPEAISAAAYAGVEVVEAAAGGVVDIAAEPDEAAAELNDEEPTMFDDLAAEESLDEVNEPDSEDEDDDPDVPQQLSLF
ncbi:MAG TPA: hypothetical protein VKY59_15470 [Spirillospora sp.]|nr:hypothetical protein [Spirillospora sp.]